MKYRTRPHEVEAFRYGFDPQPSWFKICISAGWAIANETGATIRMKYDKTDFIPVGDWVVQGYNGIPHRVHADDFERLYEPCE